MRSRCRQLPTLALVLALPSVSLAQSRFVTFSPSADTTIIRNNLDPSSHLADGAGESLFAGRTFVHADYIHRALVRFDLVSLPCNSRVVSVSLSMRVISGPTGSPPSVIELHRALASWGEGASTSFGGQGAPSEPGDADWSDRFHPDVPWATPGGDFVSTRSASASVPRDSGPAVWTSTPAMVDDVRGWIAHPETNFGWLLLANESVIATVRKFASRTASAVSSRPSLRVEYLPCPIDFDCSGDVGLQDIFAYLNAWFSGDTRSDFNLDGALALQDIFDFLGAWFLGC